MIAAGTRVRDRYRLVAVLGEGSQGRTWAAIDEASGREVALKVFEVRGARSWKDVELAEREARVLAELRHPSLPAYLGHFEEEGRLWLAMERVEGESLAALRRRGVRLDRAEIARLLADLGDVLAYLHGLSPPVVHRDVKPGNVIRRPDGSFALVDFGAVRDRLRPDGGSTVVGTFGYMAPEQLQGRALPQTDVYGLGATVLATMTGVEPEKLPHRGLAIDVRAALGPAADEALVAALAQMLEPDPDRRASRVPAIERPRSERAAGEGSRRARAEARRAARDAWRSTWHERGGYGHRWHHAAGPPWALWALGLWVAEVAVALALQIVVPVLLTILSAFFGRGLRDAAARVARAGRHATRSLDELRRAARGDRAATAGRGGARVRVDATRGPAAPGGARDADEPRPRVRVEDEPGTDEEVDEHGWRAPRRDRRDRW